MFHVTARLMLKPRSLARTVAGSSPASSMRAVLRAIRAEMPQAEAEARLRPLADNLVRQKRTKIEPGVVAKVLALREAQTPPSRIGRLLNVHHSAVRRILESADELSVNGSGSRLGGPVPGVPPIAS